MTTVSTTPVSGESGAHAPGTPESPAPAWLLASGAFRKLFAGSFFGTLGDRLYQMAIIAAVQVAFPEATVQIALITLVGVGAQFLLFPAVGYLVDCLDRRKLMRGIVLIKVALVLVAMPLLANPSDPAFRDIWYYALTVVFGISVVSTAFSPARASAIPDIATPDQYGLAASLLATTGLLSILIGSTVGAYLAGSWLNPMLTVPVASGVYAVATLCLWWLPDAVAIPGKDRADPDAEKPGAAAAPVTTGEGNFLQRLRGYVRETFGGVTYCLKRRGIPALILFETTFWVCAVSFYLLLEWHGANRLMLVGYQKTTHLGLSMGAAGVGLFLGALGVGKLCRHLSPLFTYPVAFVVVGVAMKAALDASFDATLGSDPETQARLLLPWLFFVGLGGGMLLGRIDADLLAITGPEVRGRVFSIKGFFFSGALLLPVLMILSNDPATKENLAYFMPWVLILGAIPVIVLAWILDVGIYTLRPNQVVAEFQELVSFFSARFVAWLLFKIYFRIEVEGEEHIPKEGPVLLAANHGSFLDPIWMGCSVTRRVQYIMHSSYYYGLGHPFYRLMNTIPVDQSSAIRALKQGSEALSQGVVLGMFPEGHVSDDGQLQKPKAGVLFLAQRSGAPVVPVAIVGNTRAFARWHAFPRPRKIKVIVMEPITIPRKADRKEVAEITDRIMARIAEKLNLPAPPPCADDVTDRRARGRDRDGEDGKADAERQSND